MRKHATIQSIISSMSEQFGPWPRAYGFVGLNNNVYRRRNNFTINSMETEWNAKNPSTNIIHNWIYFNIINNTLHQIECNICWFGGGNICRNFAQFHTCNCCRFCQLLGCCMWCHSLFNCVNKMFFLQMTRWTRRTTVCIHNFFQHFLQFWNRIKHKLFGLLFDKNMWNLIICTKKTGKTIIITIVVSRSWRKLNSIFYF